MAERGGTVARPAAAGAGPHDGDAGRGAARAGHAGGVGRAGRRRRRPARVWPSARAPPTCSSCSGCPTRRRSAGSRNRSTAPCAAAIFVKEPSPAAVKQAVALGTAVVAVEPRARWELLYKLVNHAFEHHGDRGDPLNDSGTDLFGLAQSIAERTHGMISIEDDQSHVLAYSASNEEADELRRLTILGRAGPPEHLEWIGQWGIFDALQASGDVVRVAERPELGLRPRLAVGHPPARDRPATTSGLRGHDLAAAGLGAAGRRCGGGAARRGGAGGTHHVAAGGCAVDAYGRWCRTCSGSVRTSADVGAIARELGIAADGRAALVGFRAEGSRGALQRDRVERERFSCRCAGGVDRRAGVRAVAEDRSDVVADVVGAGHGRRAAPRAGTDDARGDRRPADRAGRCGRGPRRGGPRIRQRRPPPRRHRSGHVTGRGAHHGAARRDRRACGGQAAARRSARPRTARAGSDARRHAGRLSGRVRRHRRVWRSGCMCTRTRCATACAGSRSCCRRRWTIPTTGSSSHWACGRPSAR